MDKDIAKRIATEKKVVSKLIDRARAHGFMPLKVYDGEERVKTPTKSQMMEVIFGLDESVAYFRREGDLKAHCAVIILGNDGWDAIADASMGDGWDEVIEEVSAYAEELCS